MNIRRIRQANNVRRFHTQERVREETVGHHSANVAALVLALHPTASGALIKSALMHDWPEYLTGDIPYPAKKESPELAAECKILERSAWAEMRIGMPTLSEYEQTVLKLADMADLVLSSIEEKLRGNQFADELINNGMEYIDKMDLPAELRARWIKIKTRGVV